MAAEPVSAAQPGDANSLLFVGSKTAPNTTGLRWFLEKVWPSIRSRNPRMKLEVLGTVFQDFAEAPPPGVRFHGLVDNLDEYYKTAGLVISPLLFGSGLKVKLIEALAQGKAVVATDITLQGVAEMCGDAVARANDAEEFVNQILDLGRNEERRLRLAQAGLETVRRHFAPEAAHSALVDWLGSRNHPDSQQQQQQQPRPSAFFSLKSDGTI